MNYHTTDPYPHPLILSRPITAAARAHALPLGTQTAAERAAAKIEEAVMAQIEEDFPDLDPEEAAQWLKLTEHELQVTTHPDGSVSMAVSYNVTARKTT